LPNPYRESPPAEDGRNEEVAAVTGRGEAVSVTAQGLPPSCGSDSRRRSNY